MNISKKSWRIFSDEEIRSFLEDMIESFSLLPKDQGEQIIESIADKLRRIKFVENKDTFLKEYKKHLEETLLEDREPRFLEDSEIEEIADYVFDNISYISPAPKTRESIIGKLGKTRISFENELRQYKLTPLAIDLLKLDVRQKLIRTFVTPGTHVGGMAANSTGEAATQAALNTIHSSGSSKTQSSGIKATEELYNISMDRHNPGSYLVFNKKYSFDEVIIEGTKELVEFRVINKENKRNSAIKNYIVESTREIFRKIGDNEIKEPWWYSMYRNVADSIPSAHPEINEKNLYNPEYLSNFMIRAELDIDNCYMHGVTGSEVVDFINNIYGGIFKCVLSPMIKTKKSEHTLEQDEELKIVTNIADVETYIMYIDIFVIVPKIMSLKKYDNLKLSSIPEDKVSLIILNTIAIDLFKKTTIKGIQGIHKLYPIVHNIWGALKNDTIYSIEENGITWMLKYDKDIVKKLNIEVENIIELSKKCNLKYILNEEGEKDGWNQSYILLKTPTIELPKDFLSVLNIINVEPEEYIVSEKDQQLLDELDLRKSFATPTQWVNYYIRKDRQEIKSKEKDLIRKRNLELKKGNKDAIFMSVVVPTTELMNLSEIVTANCDGYNMPGIYYSPDVNAYSSYGNNFYDILNTLGIEAFGNFMKEEFKRVYGKLDTGHTDLEVDVMTHYGFPTKFLLSGYEYHHTKNSDTLSRVAYGKSYENLISGAGMGPRQPLSSASSSLIMGKPISAGTGLNSFQVVTDENYEKKILDNINNDRIDEFTNDIITENLEEYENRTNQLISTSNFSGDITTAFGSNIYPEPRRTPKILTKRTDTIPPTPTKKPIIGKSLLEISKNLSQSTCTVPTKYESTIVKTAYDVGPKHDSKRYDQISYEAYIEQEQIEQEQIEQDSMLNGFVEI